LLSLHCFALLCIALLCIALHCFMGTALHVMIAFCLWRSKPSKCADQQADYLVHSGTLPLSDCGFCSTAAERRFLRRRQHAGFASAQRTSSRCADQKGSLSSA
jgi:hypothetical protein